MIVVMPLGYGDMSFIDGAIGDMWKQKPLVDRNTNLFAQALLTEILPRVEAEYNVSTKREDRALAGLSMGGLETITVGLNHTDKFASFGSFSGAVHLLDFPKELPVLNPRPAPRTVRSPPTSASSGSPAEPTTASSKPTASSSPTSNPRASPSPPSKPPEPTSPTSGATTSSTSPRSSSARANPLRSQPTAPASTPPPPPSRTPPSEASTPARHATPSTPRTTT